MEAYQKQFIRENLPELIENTNYSKDLLDSLFANKFLLEEEMHHLNSIQHKRAQVAVLYDILQEKQQGFSSLQNVMQEAGQTGVGSILDRCQVGDMFRYRSISYKRSMLIGRGIYGSSVYQGQYRSKDVAVKKIYNDHDASKSLVEGQVELLVQTQPHDRIIKYLKAEYATEFILIAMELSATNLDDWVGKDIKELPFNPLDLLGQIADGVAHLHSKGIIHGNLHPGNILISVTEKNNACVRLSDFGMFNTITCESNKRQVFLSGFGTGGWMPPEVIQCVDKKDETPVMDNSADIFSLGCIFYYFLTDGKHPFGNGIQKMGNILDGNVTLSESEFTVIDFGALNFIWLIRQMVSQRKTERPPAQAILSHPVFWPNARVGEFLHDVLPFIEKHCTILDNCATFVTRNGNKSESGTGHGNSGIAQQYLNQAGYPNEIKLSLLLKVIHMMPLPLPEDIANEASTDYPRIWLSQFPYLLPVTWTILQMESGNASTQKYYKSNGSFKFNLVRKSGNLFEIFPFPQLDSDEDRCAFLGFAETLFKSKLKQQIPLEEQESGKLPFYDDAHIKGVFEEVKSETLNDIYELLTIDTGSGITGFKESFQQIVDSILKSHLTKNKEHCIMAEQILNSVVSRLLSKFRGTLEKYFSHNQTEYDDQKVEQIFQNFRSCQLQSFQLATKSYGEELYGRYLIILEKNMSDVYMELRNRHKGHMGFVADESENFLENDLTEYEIKLCKVAQDGRGINEAGLRMMHSLKVESVLDKLKQSGPPPDGSPNAAERRTKLLDRLDKIFSNVLSIVYRESTSNESASMEEYHGHDDKDELDNLMLSPDPNAPSSRPIQFLNVLLEDGSHNKQLRINHENLNFVLDQARDLPVCVISICGLSLLRKNFLLSCIVRHLERMENGKDVTATADDKSGASLCFDFASKDINGFWMWNRPFIIKSNEGDEIAVLLLDTQGQDSWFTLPHKKAVIAGMSILASSVVIFNVSHSLQEDDLVAINNYTHYGIQALEKANDHGFPFQKLVFLVRDWNNPDEFPFGFVGGKSYLEEKLKTHTTHDTYYNKNYYENMECFLLPDIEGEVVFTDVNSSMETEILGHHCTSKLEEFCTGIINPADIPVKKILGCHISASEFKANLSSYTEIFNSPEFSSPHGTLLSMSPHESSNPIAEAVKTYLTFIETNQPERTDYVTEEVLDEMHTFAENTAFDIFKQHTPSVNSELKEKMQSKLKSKLQSQYSQIIRHHKFILKPVVENYNHFKTEHLLNIEMMKDKSTACVSAAHENYKKLITKEIGSVKTVDELLKYHKTFKAESVTGLHAALQGVESDILRQSELTLIQRIEESYIDVKKLFESIVAVAAAEAQAIDYERRKRAAIVAEQVARSQAEEAKSSLARHQSMHREQIQSLVMALQGANQRPVTVKREARCVIS